MVTFENHTGKFQLICDIVPNLLSSVFTKSDRPNFVIYPTQSAFLIRGNLINLQIGRLPFSELVNSEVSLFYCCHVWFHLTSTINQHSKALTTPNSTVISGDKEIEVELSSTFRWMFITKWSWAPLIHCIKIPL